MAENEYQEAPIEKEMQSSYLDYAMSVIIGRALPDARDGLKPAQRRILWSMYGLRNFHDQPTKKSARVVGECFIKDTLILTDKGLIPIQNIKEGDNVYTQNGLHKVTGLYIMPKRKLIKVKLSDGLQNIVTESQKFKVLTKEWDIIWKEAKDLDEGDHILTRSVYPDITDYVKLGEGRELNENIAYILGQWLSDGFILMDNDRGKYHRIGFCSSSIEVINTIALCLQHELNYNSNIEKKEIQYLSKDEKIHVSKMYSIRINTRSVCNFFIKEFDLLNRKALTKRVPEQIFRSPKSVISSFLSGLVDGDGHIHKRRDTIEYATISKDIARQLTTLLQHFNIHGYVYETKKEGKEGYILGRKVHLHDSFSLEFNGVNAHRFALVLNLRNEKKRIRLIRLLSLPFKKSSYDVLPWAGEKIFGELSKKHLGGGWYSDSTGKKFRAGVKYRTGTKIRYGSDLQTLQLRTSQIVEWGILSKLDRINSEYVPFINSIMQNSINFSSVETIEEVGEDTTYDIGVEGEHELIANGMIAHNCIGKYHPHGDIAAYGTLIRMAQWFSMNHMLVEGQGNMGCFTGDTKVRLVDGRDVNFIQLIEEQANGKRHWAYSINPATHLIEIAEIKSPRLTRKNTELVEITLDNGEKIRCTPDHRFLTRSGIYRQAKDLVPGDSLMPLYTKIYDGSKDKNMKGYETILQPRNNEWQFTHRLSNEWSLREGIYAKSKGKIRHHADFNKKNNNPDNIVRLGQIVQEAKTQNHKVVYVKFIRDGEDTYDLTIEPFHNFALSAGVFVHNSIDGDPPAAQRYTEVRLNRLAEEMLSDIEKKSVPFGPNFDNTEEEPLILPAKVPNLLINGASGIAVGVATNIMLHNLRETCDAVTAYVDNPDITPQELLQYIKGPDFPTGGTVFYSNTLAASYITGRGSCTIRGKIVIEEQKGRRAIIVTEIPYNVNKATLVQKIAELVKEKRIQGISDLRDESGKEGIRIAIDLRKDGAPDSILNTLYKHTQLQVTIPVMNIAVIKNSLVTLNLKQFIKVFVDHRIEVIRSRTKYDLDVASDRLHIVDGLLIAIANIDAVVAAIKQSSDAKEARAGLIDKYSMTEKQANAVLDMKLSKLTGLESASLQGEKVDLEVSIKDYKNILENQSRIMQIIRDETKEIKEKYGRDRRTVIDKETKTDEIENEDLIVDEDTTVILTKKNYMKRMPTNIYKSQGRGGKGVIAIELREGDFVKQISSCRSKDYLFLLTNKGRAYWLKAYQVPEANRYSVGKAAVNLVKLSEGETVEKVVSTRAFSTSFLTFITKKGTIKRVKAESFSKPRSNGIMALPLNQGDTLADACISDGKSNIFIATKKGKALRFNENDIRPMGRNAHGVRGIRISQGDEVVNLLQASEADLVTTITENGFGKVTKLNEYRLQRRGGKGVINLKVKEKTGMVVKSLKSPESSGILLINSKGLSIQFPISTIRVTGRSASGVRLMRVEKGTSVVDAQVL